MSDKVQGISPVVIIPNGDPAVEYRQVVGFPAYAVGEDGTAWSRMTVLPIGCNGGSRSVVSDKWKQLSHEPNNGDYPGISLSAGGGKYIKRRISRMVLEAFVGPCPPGMEACHDPDPTRQNCRISNLRWDTHKNNAADKIKHGTAQRGNRHPRSKVSWADAGCILELLASGLTKRVIGLRFGVSEALVRKIEIGDHWTQRAKDGAA